MADNDLSQYNLRYNQISKRLEAQGGTPSWNPIPSADSLFTPTNVRYVDGGNGSDDNTGGPTSPLKTISAACASIGSATTSAEYNDAATAYCMIIVSPGTYTENVALPQRQIVSLQLQSALIVGDVTQVFSGPLATGPNVQHKVLICGNDSRPSYTAAGIPLTGVQGNISLLQNDPSGVTILQLLNTGVTGNITGDATIGTYTLQIFFDNAMYLGDILVLNGVSSTVYAVNCNQSGSKSLGGAQGAVTLSHLNHVIFTRALVISGQSGGAWYNVQFSNHAHDFTGYAGTVNADANSYQSWVTNVPTKGTVAFSLVDSALGVAYVPTTSSNWPVVPATTQAALDTLASASLPAVVGSRTYATQTASITLTTLYTTPASSSTVLYRINLFLETTTAGSAGSVTINYSWTKVTGQVYNDGTGAIDLTALGTVGHVTDTFLAQSASNITFHIDVTGNVGAQYSFQARLESLG